MSESPFQKPNLQNGKDTHFERVYYLRLIVRYTVNPSWPFKMIFSFHDFERSDLTYHLNIIVSTTPVGSLVVCLRMQGSRFAEDLNGLGKPVVHVVVVGAQEVGILKERISLLINICVAVKRRSLTLSFVFCVQHNHLEVLVFSKFIFILLLLLTILLLLLLLPTSLLIFVDGCMIILIASSFLKIMML